MWEEMNIGFDDFAPVGFIRHLPGSELLFKQLR